MTPKSEVSPGTNQGTNIEQVNEGTIGNSLIYNSPAIIIKPHNPQTVRAVVRLLRDDPGHSILQIKELMRVHRNNVDASRDVAEAVEMLEVTGYLVKRNGNDQRYYLTPKAEGLI